MDKITMFEGKIFVTLLLTLAVSCAEGQVAESQKENISESVKVSGFESELLDLVNAYRKEKSLRPVEFDQKIYELAKEHSLYQKEKNDLNHDNFKERMSKSGKLSCVENVGWNYQTAKAQFEGWKKSPGHNKNMLSPDIELIGFSQEGAYTTMFACRK